MEPRIRLPIPYKQTGKNIKSLKKIDDKLKALNKVGSEKTLTFVGSNEVEAMFYLYLFKKYKSNCFLHDNNNRARAIGMSFKIKDNYTAIEEEEIMTHFSSLTKSLVDCIMNVESKIIIIPIQLRLPENKNHANVFIYRKNLNQIEHFEPHGSHFARNQMYVHNQTIERWLKAFVFDLNSKLRAIKHPEVRFISSSEVCPRIDGLQNLEGWSNLTKIVEVEPDGYCAAWSLFFTELSLKNPEIPSSELLNYIFMMLERMDNVKKMNYLREVIRGYSVFINEKINQYFSVFFNTGITVEKLKSLNRLNKRKVQNILKNLINLEINLSTNPAYLKNVLIETQQILAQLNVHLKLHATDNQLNEEIMKLMNKKSLYEAYDKFVISDQSDQSLSNRSLSDRSISKSIQPKTSKSVKICPEGKEISPLTGRCIKIKTQKAKMQKEKVPKPMPVPMQEPAPMPAPVPMQEPAPAQVKPAKICPEGKEINPLSGRCIKIKTQKVRPVPTQTKPTQTKQQKVEVKPAVNSVKICPEGKEINPLSGRCIKIKTKKVKK
jgi:hypothetical protein